MWNNISTAYRHQENTFPMFESEDRCFKLNKHWYAVALEGRLFCVFCFKDLGEENNNL